MQQIKERLVIMECKVEGNEIVLRLSIDAIRNVAESEFFNNVRIINDEFFNKLCERIVDDLDTGEDFYLNDFLDDRIALMAATIIKVILQSF